MSRIPDPGALVLGILVLVLLSVWLLLGLFFRGTRFVAVFSGVLLAGLGSFWTEQQFHYRPPLFMACLIAVLLVALLHSRRRSLSFGLLMCFVMGILVTQRVLWARRTYPWRERMLSLDHVGDGAGVAALLLGVAMLLSGPSWQWMCWTTGLCWAALHGMTMQLPWVMLMAALGWASVRAPNKFAMAAVYACATVALAGVNAGVGMEFKWESEYYAQHTAILVAGLMALVGAAS